MKHGSFFLLFALILSGCATFRPGAPSGMTDVIAHRGASHDAPENTLPAFELAIEQGADWFELDCRLSQDGAVVVFHDDNLERITGLADRVDALDFASLRTLDAGAWKGPSYAGAQIPTLAESLDLAKGRIGVYVEIKNAANDGALLEQILAMSEGVPVMTDAHARKILAAIEESGTKNLELTRKTLALIRERHMEKEIVIQSFSPVICAVARIEAPEMRVEFLAGAEPDKHEDWARIERWAFLLDLHGVNISYGSLTSGRVAVVRESGKTMAVWTVDDLEQMRHCTSLGVDAIITNVPSRCLKLLGRASSAQRK
ncbi:MAG TPA: glycerophosphodiester phosphodiesterase family protein [Candidatus Hydrogenedentes bacterium]|jgi:glycerophosphoryl diester phosphodiesterase|nr:MAG: Glycerophosphoryl diester phosphodiesterase [Candidatus Hydrogenedentes bacterium ADurb.Bin170]HOD94597.1 glycerophosphodiester phosphodiesterase family protein [Candidatus Hydrogenedentota bacterium]HOM48478.1 glycerophosphodiester phosphodiesterase family protein [Candidatus Hydrogenedentota bacterium]HOR50804.1 glycerophosphodiester phosphodiesterase family protein [Candidatus Hydrogenedentota bacterium]HPK24022.1 glycerophosphodiester phosphodiesterase family protein [Candidatus Hyd